MKTLATDTVKVAVVRADGAVSIMSILTVGRGNVLPSGAVWGDEQDGLWLRSPTDDVIHEEVARSVPGFARWSRVEREQIPADRTFRDALRHDGNGFTHEMPHAREIARRNIRHARAEAMPELDAQWMRATGRAEKKTAAIIEQQRQQWRDAPADPRIDAAQTIDELNAVMPANV